MPEELTLTRGGIVSLVDLPSVASELLEAGKGLSVWFLIGEMGAGKTTLARQIVAQLGIDTNVASPTFSIVNQYGCEEEEVVYHFDLYRLKSEIEALDIGIEEYMNSGNICLVEWPEKIKSLWPNHYFEVLIQHQSASTRKIYYRRHD